MQSIPGLAIARAETDADLEAMIEVRVAADPMRTPPRIENLRHHLEDEANTFLVARCDAAPAGCGFVYTGVAAAHAEAHCVVAPAARRRGVGSALLAKLGVIAAAHDRRELEGEIRADDEESRAFFLRRGYRVVGGEQAVALELEKIDEPLPQVPAGITITTRAERPDLTDALFRVAQEGTADIPGSPGATTFAQFRQIEIDRPSRKPEYFFIALDGDEPVGYATLDDFGRDAHNGLTAVRRAWRRRGIATALKQTQIAAAKRGGFRRLVTASEERNAPMRNLNAKLGYVAEPSLSTVVVRGPVDVRSAHGHD